MGPIEKCEPNTDEEIATAFHSATSSRGRDREVRQFSELTEEDCDNEICGAAPSASADDLAGGVAGDERGESGSRDRRDYDL